MIHATPFDNKTKRPLAASTPMHCNTLDEAAALIPALPIKRTKNTIIYEGLCLSWIRFAL